jgi:hypothetical protein
VSHDRFKRRTPVVGAADVTIPQTRTFKVAVLI